MTAQEMHPTRPAALPHQRAQRYPWLHLRWLAVLISGVLLYALVQASLLHTQDPVYVPALLLLGAAIVPAAFTTFVTEIRLPRRLTVGVIVAAAVVGGVIGAIVAGQLEIDTVRQLGHLPTVLIGLIEESAKLAVPAALLLWWRNVRAADGILLGVAVGSGFAALETMGYGFVAMLQSHGDLTYVTDLLTVRAVAAPGGHAAWTGLACAALFAIRGAARPGWAWLRFAVVFGAVVALHAMWDSNANGYGFVAVGALSFTLLMVTTWRLRRKVTPEQETGTRRLGATPLTAIAHRPATTTSTRWLSQTPLAHEAGDYRARWRR